MTPTSEPLKACPNPWCKYNDGHMGMQRCVVSAPAAFSTRWFKVKCACGFSGPTITHEVDELESIPIDQYPGYHECIAAWNTRPTPSDEAVRKDGKRLTYGPIEDFRAAAKCTLDEHYWPELERICNLARRYYDQDEVRKVLENSRNALVTAQTLTTDPDDFKTFHDSILEIDSLKEAANGKG